MIGVTNISPKPKIKISRNKISFSQVEFFKVNSESDEAEALFNPVNLYNTINGSPISMTNVSELFNWEHFFRNELLAGFNDQLSSIYKYARPTILQIEFRDIPILLDKTKDFGVLDLKIFRTHPEINKFELSYQWTARRSFLEGLTKSNNYYKISGIIDLRINFWNQENSLNTGTSDACSSSGERGSPRLVCILRRYSFKG